LSFGIEVVNKHLIMGKWHDFNFMVLEKRPTNSDHPQGDRVIECFQFSRDGLRLNGKPRFQSFSAVLSMPQNGERVEADLLVKDTMSDHFEVNFVSPSKRLIELLSWWDVKERPEPQPSPDQRVGIYA
jgi:hypothetical protein